jgi:lipopolysaccharide export system permease protein
VKIISRYILREHVGPFFFALTALTSLMLLNFISRQFGELVGKGLPASVIGEFFLLSVPFTVALTLPMSVLVAVLYAFSRLAAENEITALKASGVSPWRLVTPAIVWGVLMSIFLLAFNDQVLPRANHRLKTLQDDISQTKPTFLLKDQVINAISEGKLYLKAGKIDRTNGKMREVVIYDLADPTRRRTIYADSGLIQMAENHRDLELELHSGQMQEVATEKPGQLDRLFYKHDLIRVRDVAGDFKQSKADTTSRGDRELGVCEMQKRLRVADVRYQDAKHDYEEAERLAKSTAREAAAIEPTRRKTLPPEPRGIGWAYCALVTRLFGVRAAEAAEIHSAGLHSERILQDTVPKKVQDTTKKAASDTSKKLAPDTTKKRPAPDTARRAPALPTADPRVLINGVLVDPRTGLPAPPAGTTPQPGVILGTSTPPAPGSPGAMPVPPPTTAKTAAEIAAEALTHNGVNPEPSSRANYISHTSESRLQLEMAEHTRNRFEIEIHKKFSLAAACLIFVVLGAPLAVRFPRGGVGLVIGVSLVVFALYYVGLIGGEAMANKGLVPPFWAMWGTNVILTVIGIVLLFRMGHEQSSGRGGDWGDRIDQWRDALRTRRRARLTKEHT